MAAGDEPLGLFVTRAAAEIRRALDGALNAAGGSVPTWLVLSALRTGGHATLGELADDVGVRQPTLTHHLNALETAGLVRRERDPANRRVQRVALTDAGDALFLRLRRAAGAFDGRLRAGLEPAEEATLRHLLSRLVEDSRPD